MEIIYLIIGLLTGAGAAYLVSRGKSAAAATLLNAERAAKAELKAECKERLEAAREEARKVVQQVKCEAEQQRTKELSELQQRYDTLLQQFKAEVTTATEKMLKERSGELQQSNTQKMDELFRPIKDDITSLQKLMNEDRLSAAQRNTHFEDIMRQMIDSNAKIGMQADRLSTALQRKNKVAGNWGELILTELLENQGLVPGTHFDVQQTIKDEIGRTIHNEDTGSRMIPDVVLHLGDNREVVVDSKMSLTAFVDYQNADDDTARQEALARHIDSVRAHYKELSAKDYSSYMGKSKKGIDFVIMFVPIDSALQLALSAEPSLWREAFDKKVFIACGQTLIAALHIIRLTWVNIQQERNTQKVMDEARKLIDRVDMFYREFQIVGQRLASAQEAYAVVGKRVDEGSQSILSLGHRLEDLGARGKKALPRPETVIQQLVIIFFLIFSAPSFSAPKSEVEKVVTEWLAAWRAPGIPDKDTCKPVSVTVDEKGRSITIVADNVFASQQFTSDVVAQIYATLRQALGEKYDDYRLHVRTKQYPIEQLVTFASIGERRTFKNEYKGAPWVQNTSRPFTFKHGMQGRHLALWASHGLYWQTKTTKKKPLPRWEWQRPYLFTTTEDILTPGIVNQLLIPMLERAGAIVFTPRERDWQRLEAIADNDTGGYGESGAWRDAGQGFGAKPGIVLRGQENPFTMGTARSCPTTRREAKAETAVWTPSIAQSGNYAVYVSYKTLKNSVHDARYTVRHAGVETTFKVNQKMGGSTWVYLGNFFFTASQPESNCVILSNLSDTDGVVTADAVRLGGGMGNIDRGGGVSGVSRYFECARYSMQWAGMSPAVYADKGQDYSDDINVRSLATNYLAGGSVYNPKESGLGVPIELSLAVHSDAGVTPDKVHGTLGVVMTTHDDGRTAEGASRLMSHDMAQVVMGQVFSDLQAKFGTWNMRQLWDRNYSESRLPVVPCMILETLSHQSLADMRLMHDPTFKFALARAIYKGLLRYTAQVHGQTEPIVQPLPITRLAAIAGSKRQEITIQWQPVKDPLEASAMPAGYVVYTKKGENTDYDNGTYTTVPQLKITAEPGVLYSFRVTAVNAGGESMPSESVCAMLQRGAKSNILIVDGFQRLAGPQPVGGGFDIKADPGVPYIGTPSFCGAQTDLVTEVPEINSGNELEGRIVVGNTRDVAVQHGSAMAAAVGINISSCTRSAVEAGDVKLEGFRLIDLAMGLQRADGYSLVQAPVFTPSLLKQLQASTSRGTNILLSGAYIGQAENAAPKKTAVTEATVSELFKYSHNATLPDSCIAGVAGMNASCTLFRSFDTRGTGLPSADVLFPTGGAFACMLYAPSQQTAAIAYAGKDYRVMAFGFPLECIADVTMRRQVMLGLLNFLL